MKRASYREAIRWIAENDDTTFLQDDEPIPSVTVAFLVDLFDVAEAKVIRDLRRELHCMGVNRAFKSYAQKLREESN